MGVRSAEQLKDPTFSQIPVVIFSAGGDLIRQIRDLGVAGYIDKPIELSRLIGAIEQFRREV